jgi:hypothetical protein
MRRLVGEMVANALHAADIDPPADADALGLVVVALEDGLRLHRIIDPDSPARSRSATPRAVPMSRTIN